MYNRINSICTELIIKIVIKRARLGEKDKSMNILLEDFALLPVMLC